MRFGLEIGERENHYYYIDRYPTGLDATVAIVDSDVTDMTFRNDTDQPIVIRGFATPGPGHVPAVERAERPERRPRAAGDVEPPDRHRHDDRGVRAWRPAARERVEFPHNGFDVYVTRTVYAADGAVVHQNTWFSDYRAVNGITLVGHPPPSRRRRRGRARRGGLFGLG